MIIFLPTNTLVKVVQLVSALPCRLGHVSVGSNPSPGNVFEFINVMLCYVCTLISPIKAKEANKDHVLQKNDKMKN